MNRGKGKATLPGEFRGIDKSSPRTTPPGNHQGQEGHSDCQKHRSWLTEPHTCLNSCRDTEPRCRCLPAPGSWPGSESTLGSWSSGGTKGHPERYSWEHVHQKAQNARCTQRPLRDVCCVHTNTRPVLTHLKVAYLAVLSLVCSSSFWMA